jgi:hypothetical protein
VVEEEGTDWGESAHITLRRRGKRRVVRQVPEPKIDGHHRFAQQKALSLPANSHHVTRGSATRRFRLAGRRLQSFAGQQSFPWAHDRRPRRARRKGTRDITEESIDFMLDMFGRDSKREERWGGGEERKQGGGVGEGGRKEQPKPWRSAACSRHDCVRAEDYEGQ